MYNYFNDNPNSKNLKSGDLVYCYYTKMDIEPYQRFFKPYQYYEIVEEYDKIYVMNEMNKN